ncbi:MAG: putative protein-disulfide isomerase [Gammaproteobacteria bacterium]|jgi:putative protein-disulfide isomerase
MQTTLIYVHDPMCSWCFGFTNTLQSLIDQLPADIKVTRLLGGLAPDSDDPMPESMRSMLEQNWQRIEQMIPGVQFNYDFWTQCQPRRSTYPACRTVIAARNQGEAFDELMTRQIQQAYYRQVRNPSDDSTLIELAGEIGLDVDVFANDLNSTETQQQLLDEINTGRSLGVNGFPSLMLNHGGRHELIYTDYVEAQPMLDQIKAILA